MKNALSPSPTASLEELALRRLDGRQHRKWIDPVIAAGLALATGVIFGGALRCGLTYWDDNLYLLENPLVVDLRWSEVFTTFFFCNYHPVTLLSFMAEYAIAGFQPWLYHLDNVVLHAASVVLAYVLGKRWLGHRGAALLGALLFAVHPLKVEAVVWVSERKGLLCSVFYLASLCAYTTVVDSPRSWKAKAACAGLFLLALLSKITAVSLPAVAFLYLLRRRRVTIPRLRFLGGLLALAAVFAAVGVAAQAEYGAVKGLHGGGLVSHALTVVKGIGFYATKLLWPVRLSARYVLEPARGPFDPLVLLGAGALAVAAAACWISFRRRRTTLLCVGVFFAAWAPVSGIVPSSTLVADRYMSLPLLGLAWLAALAVTGGLESASRRRVAIARAAVAGTVVFLAACVHWSAQRTAVWRDSRTLWEDALVENPGNGFAHNQLASYHGRVGFYEKALGHAIRTIEAGMQEPGNLFSLTLAYRGLEERQKEFDCARAILEGNPDFLPAWRVVLRHLIWQEKLDECAARLRSLLARFPGDPDLLAASGDLDRARGRAPEALEAYRRSLAARPSQPEVAVGIARALADAGEPEQALATLERVAGGASVVLFPDTLAAVDKVVARIGAGARDGWAGRLAHLRAWSRNAGRPRRPTGPFS